MNLKVLFFILSFTLIQNKDNKDKYIVDTQLLNVREFANMNSEVIGQVKLGDTIISTGNYNNWIRFSVRNDDRIKRKPINNYGYVHVDYLKIFQKKEKPEPITQENNPFLFGYIKAVKYPFFLFLLFFAGKDYIKHKKIKDGRYAKGYKEIPFSLLELIKYGFYAFIFSLPFGLIGGLYYLFLNW